MCKILISCKARSVIFEDQCCKSKEEIFPPFRTYDFQGGRTVIGADSKSFFITKGKQYCIDGTEKTYEEVLAELDLKFSAIEGSDEVQCFADLASFPPTGEDCVLYLAEDTGFLYVWNGATYVQIATGTPSVLCYPDTVSFPVTGELCTIYIDESRNFIYRWIGTSYVRLAEDVRCFNDLASFPVAGEFCVIYVAEDTNLIYRWNGSIYLPIGAPSGLKTKSGIVAFGSFAPTPILQKTAIVFATAFADNLYAVTITGEDSRSWQIEAKTSAGFTINSNSEVALLGNTFWIAIKQGES
jgi:hypothetical protein